ncbi:hypothetical protein [Haloplanus natans]|uniref:hypothetical protein n=1 Tax=Haloplanus natans TaxID=376171 RepID=UPI000677D49A|nr:hypothetical protein [Haloplanus natans]
MALQDSSGQQVHRALSTLRNIETDELPQADTRRIAVATVLLAAVSIRAAVGRGGVETTRLDPDDR